MTKAKTAVVIPAYNRASLLPRAVTSALAQPDCQVVVVDDGSTDDTAEVLAVLAEQNPARLTVLHQENKGCATARNTGWRDSSADTILFLDSDDELLPGIIALLWEKLVQSGADFVYAQSLEHLPDGQEIMVEPAAAGRPDDFTREHFFSRNARSPSIFYRRELLEKTGGLREDLLFTEDSDLLARASLAGRGAYLDKPTARVYHHDGRKSLSRHLLHEARLRSAEGILATHPAFASELGLRGTKHLALLRARYVAALIYAGQVGAARSIAKKHVMPWTLRLGLRLGSAWPVRILRRLQKAESEDWWMW